MSADNLHHMRENFEAWAQKRGYLFIDEQGGKEWDEDSNILYEAYHAGAESRPIGCAHAACSATHSPFCERHQRERAGVEGQCVGFAGTLLAETQ